MGDVTKGLIYLHDEGLVHGNLKGVRVQTSLTFLCPSLPNPKANILIDHDGRACLYFGALTIILDQLAPLFSFVGSGAIQWMSPELLDPESFNLRKICPTKESDCYALGMVIYEVLSGQSPYAPSKVPVIIRKILDGERPGRPQGEDGVLFTDGIWAMLELCWKHRPGDRAGAEAVLSCLEGDPALVQSPSPNADGDVETDDDQSDDTAASILSTSSPFHPTLL